MAELIDVGSCEKHLSQAYTYMCCDAKCFQFLCIQCIPEHCQTHIELKSYADIQLLAAVKEKCRKKLEEGLAMMDGMEKKANYNPKSSNQQGEDSDENILSLLKSREDLLQEIESYYKALITNYKEYRERSNSYSSANSLPWQGLKESLQKSLSALSEKGLAKESITEFYSQNIIERISTLKLEESVNLDEENKNEQSLVFVDRTFIKNPLKELLRNFVTILIPCEEVRKKSSEISDLGLKQISENKAKEISKPEYDQFLAPGVKKVRTSSIIKDGRYCINSLIMLGRKTFIFLFY